jgi:hypothetical protein
LAFGFVLTAMAGQTQNPEAQQKYKAAIAWLHKIEPEFSAEMKAMIPSLEAVLERYYMDPESLRQSERDLAEAFIATMPETGDGISGRGSAEDRMKDFAAILGSSPKPKPAAKPKPKTTPPPKTAPKPMPKIKLPGISSKPVYTAVEKSAPGGKKIGAVMVSIGGRKKTVIEILAKSGGMSLKQRAQIIANRMAALSKKNPLWWTTSKAGTVRGEAVVRVAGAPGGYIVTADRYFANECGVSPSQLARQLANKIRTTFDPQSGDEFGGRALTPEDMRQAAIDLRQEGDDLYATSKTQAEAKYKLAIQNDPSYHVPYLRLADMYVSMGKKDEAKSVLEEGLKVEAIGGPQRAELEARLKALG